MPSKHYPISQVDRKSQKLPKIRAVIIQVPSENIQDLACPELAEGALHLYALASITPYNRPA